MEQPGIWQSLLGGLLVAGLLFFIWPGAKKAISDSKNAEKDWKAALIPLAVVILFVLFLLSTV